LARYADSSADVAEWRECSDEVISGDGGLTKAAASYDGCFRALERDLLRALERDRAVLEERSEEVGRDVDLGSIVE
jgi:hypothetical protein